MRTLSPGLSWDIRICLPEKIVTRASAGKQVDLDTTWEGEGDELLVGRLEGVIDGDGLIEDETDGVLAAVDEGVGEGAINTVAGTFDADETHVVLVAILYDVQTGIGFPLPHFELVVHMFPFASGYTGPQVPIDVQ